MQRLYDVLSGGEPFFTVKKYTACLLLCQVFMLYHLLFLWIKNIFSVEKILCHVFAGKFVFFDSKCVYSAIPLRY